MTGFTFLRRCAALSLVALLSTIIVPASSVQAIVLPSATIGISAPPQFNRGQVNFPVTVIITNTTGSPLSGVTFSVPVPANTDYSHTSLPSSGDCTLSLGVVTCTVPFAIPANTANLFDIFFDVSPTVACDSILTSGPATMGAQTTVTVDTRVTCGAVKVGLSAPSEFNRGHSDFPVTVTVTNTLATPLVNPVVTLPVPAALSYTHHSLPSVTDCTEAAGTITCTLPYTLAPTEAQSFVVYFDLFVSDTCNTIFTNGPAQVNGFSSLTVDTRVTCLFPTVGISVPPQFNQGQPNFPVTVIITNTTNGVLHSPVFTLPVPNNTTFTGTSLSPSTSCTESAGTVTCTVPFSIPEGEARLIDVFFTVSAGAPCDSIIHSGRAAIGLVQSAIVDTRVTCPASSSSSSGGSSSSSSSSSSEGSSSSSSSGGSSSSSTSSSSSEGSSSSSSSSSSGSSEGSSSSSSSGGSSSSSSSSGSSEGSSSSSSSGGSSSSSSEGSSSSSSSEGSSSSSSSSTSSIISAFVGDVQGGNGSHRGVNTNVFNAMLLFLANHHSITATAPGGFGGGPLGPLTEGEKNMMCSYLVFVQQQQSMYPEEFTNDMESVLQMGAEQIAAITGRSIETVMNAFADEHLCDSWISRLPQAKTVVEAPVKIVVSAAGYPVEDKDLASCMQYYYEGGTMTVAEIRGRVDEESAIYAQSRTRKHEATPRSCDEYRASGTDVWTSRKLGVSFTYDPKTKSVQLPKGYVAEKISKVASTDAAL